MKSTENGFALVLCWPEKKCKRAYSWYDPIMKKIGVMKDEYYPVGHSAIVLINTKGDCHYFDFGRYQTPIELGRVRDQTTDPFFSIDTKAEIADNNVTNINAILQNIQELEGTECEGKLVAGLLSIDFDEVYSYAKNLQNKGLIPYGPFLLNGTNCSRFVRELMLKARLSTLQRIQLKYPYMVTPSPLYLVKTIGVANVCESTETESASFDLEYA
jgi:hypothetical protein